MKIKGYEKLSLVDYDLKISTTIFFGGCNFRCPFCHNSSLVISPNDSPDIKKEEILDHLRKRRGMIDAVVITGGEPTLEPNLKQFIREIKDMGYLVKLDTNGTNPNVLKDLVESNLIDYVAMDIKNSEAKYSLTTGVKVNFSNIKQSIDYLINSNIDYEFRTTVISEFHTLEDFVDISILLKGAKKMRIQKFIASENCINPDLHEVDEKLANEFVKELKKTISDVSLRGY